MSPRGLDEDDVRIRPGRGSRPRTRRRPLHADAIDALVVAVDRGRWTCRLGVNGAGREVVATRGGDLRRTPVVVGDVVSLDADVSGEIDALARMVRLSARRSLLVRTPDDTESHEKPVVANAELLVVVVALVRPEPQPRLVDRCLVAAYAGGLSPLLCLTKADLPDADDAELRALYEPLEVPVLTLAPDRSLTPLRERLAGRMAVFFGSSGVGKSSLVNRLLPAAEQATGTVSGVGKGRHTTSAAIALQLPGSGWIIDTPGVRSLGLGGVTPSRVVAAFPDLAEAAEHCPPGCDHLTAGCAFDDPEINGGVDPARLSSLRRLLTARG
ncbi:MAG TPA: ribosome small subunit-dependent GTPase A [Mycobacteriales bacterium]|nr:ribosome small subunit-dependent GTPase A [Mycobacteriales bacterium]